jgi:hypothetical protein
VQFAVLFQLDPLSRQPMQGREKDEDVRGVIGVPSAESVPKPARLGIGPQE